MTLNTVTLKWDLTDLIEAGLPGTLSITPTAQMSDVTDHVLIPVVARTYTFTGGTGQLAGIVANDNASILPAGTGYLISVTDANGHVIVPQFQTQVLFSNGATQWLDALATVPVVAAGQQYLPLPSGTATAGYVPAATGSGEASAWTALTAADVEAVPLADFTALGDTLAGSGAGTVARVAPNTSATRKFYRQTGTGSASAAPAWDIPGPVNVVLMDDLGADATGAADCTALFNSALASLPAVTVNSVTYRTGVIEFGAGSYKLGSGAETTDLGPLVVVCGQERPVTTLMYYGATRCFRTQDPARVSATANTLMGGGVRDLTIDGSNASAGAVGYMYGDLNGGRFDLTIQHFNGAGSAGLKLVNQVWDTEKTRGYARLIDNTVGVEVTVEDGAAVTGVTLASATGGTATFTVASGGFPGFYAGMLAYGSSGLTTPSSGNVSTLTIASVSGNTLTCSYTGTAPSGTSGTLTICSGRQSFDYNDLEFSIYGTGGIFTAGSPGTYAGQEGVLLSNGANPAGGKMVIRGNFAQSNSNPWTGTAPSILRLDGQTPAWHPTQGATYFSDQQMLIQAEGDPANATYQVYPVRFSGSASGSTAHGLMGCEGVIYFSGTADASLGSAPFGFSGPVTGIPSLNRTNVAGGNTGTGTGAQSYADSGRPVDTLGRAYQQITGLLGANTPFTVAGAVAGAAPAAGIFKTDDILLDLLLGGFWHCTAGGTPGTWAYLPGTPPSSSGSLAGDVPVSGETAVLTTGSLAAGTWLVNAQVTLNQATASTFSAFESRVNGGTATYSVTGQSSAQGITPSSGTASNQTVTLALSFLAVVTSAGTIVITAKNTAGAGIPSAKASTPGTGYGNATGYTAVKVA